jgi:hypothetical protein
VPSSAVLPWRAGSDKPRRRVDFSELQFQLSHRSGAAGGACSNTPSCPQQHRVRLSVYLAESNWQARESLDPNCGLRLFRLSSVYDITSPLFLHLELRFIRITRLKAPNLNFQSQPCQYRPNWPASFASLPLLTDRVSSPPRRLFRGTASAMNTLRSLRPVASRFQAAALPRVARPFSATAARHYEFIQTSEPKPGVGQGNRMHNTPCRFRTGHLYQPAS